MKALLLVFLAIPLVGCQSQMRARQPLVFSGGDGSSCQQAVVIKGATFRETGLLGRKLWLEQRYPGCRPTKDSLLSADNRRIDQVELTSVDGQTSKVYFDVTDWWEK